MDDDRLIQRLLEGRSHFVELRPDFVAKEDSLASFCQRSIFAMDADEIDLFVEDGEDWASRLTRQSRNWPVE